MPALTLDALLRSLKKKGAAPAAAPDPVYLLHGDEEVLKDEALRALLDAAVGANRDFNLDVRYAADLTPESFHALVNTPPMLAERRAVVVRGLELGKRKTKLRDELVRYLGAPNPTTVLVLVLAAGEEPEADIGRSCTAVALEPLAADRVPKWLHHHAATLGITLAPDAADLLLAAVGNDLSTLARELEKLAALAAGAGRPVTAEDVTSLVGVRRGETVHDLVHAALERRAGRAAELVEPVLEQAGMNGVKILSLLGTHLVGTAVARAERDRGAGPARLPDIVLRQLLAARPYGLRGYKEEAANWSRWSGLWSAAELGRALRAALEADNALKTATVSDDRGIVMQLVLGFARLNREAA
jgi:DNA polymerase-3 subunit delta